ncbi:MAG: hypothetical protein Q8O13_06895 [Candidatus Omnitrophota bacterium]|nr:hypothetical protein [Candidatus Omnitrophota bacterium]
MRRLKLNIWVEKLNLIDFFYFLPKSLFSNSNIYYDEHEVTKSTQWILYFLNKLNISFNFFPAYLFLNKKDEQGFALNYQMEDNLDACLEIFCKKYISRQPERFKRMLKSYLALYLYYRVTFITMVAHKPEFNCHERKNILHLAKGPCNSIVIKFYKEKGYYLQESCLSWQTFKYYLRPLYLLLKILISKFSLKRMNYNLINIKPSIWIEYAHEQIVDFSFWSEMINRQKFDIAYYLDRDDDPSIEQAAEIIEKRGFKWINLHFNSLLRLANLKLKEIKELIVVLCCFYPSYPLWFRVFKFEYKMWFLLYRSVVECFKVKILIQHQEHSWFQEAQVNALEKSGGIMVGFHWSNFPFTKESFHLTPEHAYFVWGQAKLNWVKEKGNTCRYILPSGLWVTKNRIQNSKLEDFVRNKSFVIAIFDASVVYNMYHSPENLSIFYLALLKLLEKNKMWGGIVKSKKWDIEALSFLPNGNEIISMIKSLSQENRLLYLKRVLSPIAASSYANLSVCSELSSAGIIAGICGYRAIHWDCSGWLHHPFYKEKNQKIIFQDLEEFIEAIIKISNGDKEIGDFSKWRQKFNHFDDFQASRRVGKFIQSFMEKSNGIDFEKPLSLAVKEYIEENKIEDSFFTISDWWGSG